MGRTDMSEDAAAQAEQKSERRKRRRKQQAGWQAPGIGRMILAGMTILLLGTALYTAYRFRVASLMMGPLMIDSPREEVVYLRGQPAARLDNDMRWQYDEGDDLKTTVQFNAAGRTESISCSGPGAGSVGCPDVLGIGLGTDEDTMLNRLGPPTRQSYIPGGKLMFYADLGVTFTMMEYRVTGVTKVRRSGKLDFLPRVAWTCYLEAPAGVRSRLRSSRYQHSWTARIHTAERAENPPRVCFSSTSSNRTANAETRCAARRPFTLAGNTPSRSMIRLAP